MRERERLSQRDVVNAGLDKCDNGRKGEGEKGEHVESVKRGYHNNDKNDDDYYYQDDYDDYHVRPGGTSECI